LLESKYPAAAAILTQRDLAQRDARGAAHLLTQQSISLDAKTRRAERLSAAARATRSALEQALFEWPYASFGEVEEWMAKDCTLTEERVARLRVKIAAAEERLTHCEEELSEAIGVAEVESSRLEVERARTTVRKKSKDLAYRLADLLRRGGYSDVIPIAHARFPIVKCADPRLPSVEIDISFHQVLSFERDALLREYMATSPLLRPAALLLKAWAREHRVGDASAGTLCAYGHVLSLIHYLQVCGTLPDLQQGARPRWCEDVDVGFCSRCNSRNRRRPSSAADPPNNLRSDLRPDLDLGRELRSLLEGYFDYMLRVARGPSTLAVRAWGGSHLLPKTVWQPLDQERSQSLQGRLSIEDPFESHECDSDRRRDVASAVTEGGMQRLEDEWARAGQLLRSVPTSKGADGLDDGRSTDEAARQVALQLFGALPSRRDMPSGMLAQTPRADPHPPPPQGRGMGRGGRNRPRGRGGTPRSGHGRGRGARGRGRGRGRSGKPSIQNS